VALRPVKSPGDWFLMYFFAFSVVVAVLAYLWL
jgi:hypothetical protein